MTTAPSTVKKAADKWWFAWTIDLSNGSFVSARVPFGEEISGPVSLAWCCVPSAQYEGCRVALFKTKKDAQIALRWLLLNCSQASQASVRRIKVTVE